MAFIDCNIGEVILQTQQEREKEAEQMPHLVREAFRKLGEKLQASPLVARRQNLSQIVLSRLEVSMSTDALLGPAGAEKLADELFTQLVRGI